MRFVTNFLDCLTELFAPKTEYGLTEKQQADVLWHAKRGEEGRDFAEYLGCTGYGMTTPNFYKLLTDNGLSTR